MQEEEVVVEELGGVGRPARASDTRKAGFGRPAIPPARPPPLAPMCSVGDWAPLTWPTEPRRQGTCFVYYGLAPELHCFLSFPFSSCPDHTKLFVWF